MPDFGINDPLSAAVRGRGSLYALDTATQPGQNPLDRPLIDQAIDARSQFESRRQQLLARLPNARRREGLAIGYELRHMDNIERVNAARQLAEQRQLNFEANQRRMLAHTDALEADRKWKMDRETDIDEHGAAMIEGLGRLRGAFRNGRISEDQYHEGLLDLGQRYPYALRHPEAAKRYEFDVSEADKMRDFAQRRSISDSLKIASRYGIQPVVNESTGLPDLEATQNAAMQTPKFRLQAIQDMNKEMFQKYGVGTGVASLFNPVAPHTSPDNGKTIDLPFHDKTGAIQKHNVPMDLFNAMKTDFNDRYFALVPQGQPAAQSQAHPADQEAVQWATAHPDDPRAQQILQLNQ